MFINHARALVAHDGGLASFEPVNSMLCSADGDPPSDPGGGEKTFTQSEVTTLIGREVAKAKAPFKDFEDVKAKAGQVDELTSKMAELQQQIEDAGKTAEQKERDRGEREAKTLKDRLVALQSQVAESDAKIAAEAKAHRQTRAAHQLATALAQADVHPQASDDALRALMNESELEFGDDGRFTGITLPDGSLHAATALKEAATAFLETKPFYAKAPPGGAGIHPPTGGGTGDGRAMHELSPAEALKLDAQRRSARR